MTSVFTEQGDRIACTVVEMGPCVVTQVKTEETDKYNALQLGFEDVKEKSVSQPLQGHFKKANTDAKRVLAEFRDFPLEKNLGDHITVDEVFEAGDTVLVRGTSKGKGFQGVVKRHGFGGVGMRTHGQHNRERAPGSIGAASDPSKVIKGLRMAGRTGGKSITVRNLRVVRVFPEKNILLIKGAVPGHKGSFVIVEK